MRRGTGIDRGINLIGELAAGLILALLAIALLGSLTGCCSSSTQPGPSHDERKALEQLNNEHRGGSAALRNYRGH